MLWVQEQIWLLPLPFACLLALGRHAWGGGDQRGQALHAGLFFGGGVLGEKKAPARHAFYARKLGGERAQRGAFACHVHHVGMSAAQAKAPLVKRLDVVRQLHANLHMAAVRLRRFTAWQSAARSGWSAARKGVPARHCCCSRSARPATIPNAGRSARRL